MRVQDFYQRGEALNLVKRHKFVIGLTIFCAVGWLQQQYVKARAQSAYETRCAEIARNPKHPASPCASPTPPGIPLPARG
ncbi:hypothetical protein D5S10_29695 (plasmid) [Pseudomonas savastanoi]|nr:hypothetical protein D5S10_29695 [Pseudomonas savastanoi]QOQ33459.1 hypothetical protein [Pseudomonas syringae pv. actinidiae]